MSATLIRPAQLSDVTTLATMMIEFYAEAGLVLDRGRAQAAFERLIKHRELGCVWVLECDSAVAGYVVLTLMYAMEYGALRGFIDDLYVRASFRRRGLAGAALSRVRAYCLESQVSALFVQAGADNDAAQRTYKSAGFVDTGHQLLARALAPPIHHT
jgi:ribosomal protein S18 acetylase RimI-like enzyme